MSCRQQLKISLHSLPSEGMDLQCEVEAAAFDIAADEVVQLTHPVKLELYIRKVQAEVLVRGKFTTQVQFRCDRCLVNFAYELSNDQLCYLLEDCNDEIIDLTEPLREDIILAFPQHLLCSEQCRGLCPHCGEDLNQNPCRCTVDDGTAGVWGILDKLIDEQVDDNSDC